MLKPINVSYKIRYETKRGGSGMITMQAIEQVKNELLRLFKNRLTAKAEKNNVIIGEVYKQDGRWNWYLDTEA